MTYNVSSGTLNPTIPYHTVMDFTVTVCVIINCCLSLYLNIAGLWQSPGETASEVPEMSWNFF